MDSYLNLSIQTPPPHFSSVHYRSAYLHVLAYRSDVWETKLQDLRGNGSVMQIHIY